MYWDTLIELLRDHPVYIQTHDFPDPDALASAFALQGFLRSYQIPSHICYAGRIETHGTLRMIKLLEIQAVSIDDMQPMSENDYVINVDAQKGNTNITNVPGTVVACIDHHPLVGTYPYLYQDVRQAGSCAALLAGYFHDSNVPIGTKEATALLYGIHVDTNHLRRGVNFMDVDMYHYLYPHADRAAMSRMLQSKLEVRDLKAFGAAIHNIAIAENIGFAYIPFDCPDALLGMLSDFLLSLDVVYCAIVYTLRPSGWKISVRCSAESIHAGQMVKEVAESFGGGGGGHAEMAAGFIPKTEPNTENEPQEAWESKMRKRFVEAVHKYRIKA